MKKITAKEFFRLCRGAKKTSYEAVEGVFGFVSYLTTYERKDGFQIFKMENVPCKATQRISFAYYKEA